eukprot:gene7298-8486_t
MESFTSLFFRVFRNKYLVTTLWRDHVRSKPSMFSQSVSSAPMRCKRYSRITSFWWMLVNEHFGLIKDKLLYTNGHNALALSCREPVHEFARIRDIQLFEWLYDRFQDHFTDDVVVRACTLGNLGVVQSLMRLGWPLTINCLEHAIKNKHLALIEFLLDNGVQPEYQQYQNLFYHGNREMFKLIITKHALASPEGRLMLDESVDRVGLHILYATLDYGLFLRLYGAAATRDDHYFKFLQTICRYDIPETRITQDNWLLIGYVQAKCGSRTSQMPASVATGTLDVPALYGAFIRWMIDHYPGLLTPIEIRSQIMTGAAQIDDLELVTYLFEHEIYNHRHKYITQAVIHGSYPLISYMVENGVGSQDSGAAMAAAISRGDHDVLALLLDSTHNTLTRNETAMALDAAVLRGDEYALEVLLTYAADHCIKVDMNPIALLAAKSGHIHLFTRLLDDTTTSIRSQTISNIAGDAIDCGNDDIIRVLIGRRMMGLTNQVTHRVVGNSGDTEFYEAVKTLVNAAHMSNYILGVLAETSSSGHLLLTRHILQDPPHDLHFSEGLIRSLFEGAVNSGNLEILRYLLSRTKELKKYPRRKTLEALMARAVRNQYLDIVKHLRSLYIEIDPSMYTDVDLAPSFKKYLGISVN